jgi:hypothetical protein
MRNAQKILLGKPERKKPLGRPRHRWKESIKMNFWKMGFDCMNWIHLAQDTDK